MEDNIQNYLLTVIISGTPWTSVSGEKEKSFRENLAKHFFRIPFAREKCENFRFFASICFAKKC